MALQHSVAISVVCGCYDLWGIIRIILKAKEKKQIFLGQLPQRQGSRADFKRTDGRRYLGQAPEDGLA
jgi:hypothetical protein